MTMTKFELLNSLNTKKNVKVKVSPSTVNKVKEDVVPEPAPQFNSDQVNTPVIDKQIKRRNKVVPTDGQAPVIKDIKNWFFTTPGYGVYELAGYAGVGKSTVVDIILEELNLTEHDVRLCAPTGTASLVLKEKTPGFFCSTMHKVFYVPETNKFGRTIFVPSPDNIRGIKLIIIDEASMVGERTANEILPMARKAGCRVLIVGDPGQLPPVKDNEYFFKNPNSILTEVLRQSADNPIIALSMAIRKATDNGTPYYFPKENKNYGGKVYIYDRNRITINQYAKVVANGGVVIAGMNKTRQSLNTSIRTHLGFDQPMLMNDEKVVIKENIAEGSNGEIAVTNGMRGTVSNVKRLSNGLIKFKFIPEAFEGYRYLEVHEDVLFERKTIAQLRKENYERRAKGQKEIEVGDEVLFGYVITAHASQGSQWKTVYVINESGVFNRRGDADGYKNQNRWLYTAVTRAAENLVVLI